MKVMTREELAKYLQSDPGCVCSICEVRKVARDLLLQLITAEDMISTLTTEPTKHKASVDLDMADRVLDDNKL